jgi:MFS family permease
MLMNSFAPSLPLKFKTQFILAGFCYIMSYLLVIPDWGTTYMYIGSIVGVIFGGVGASIFWISQGAYMDMLCTIN